MAKVLARMDDKMTANSPVVDAAYGVGKQIIGKMLGPNGFEPELQTATEAPGSRFMISKEAWEAYMEYTELPESMPSADKAKYFEANVQGLFPYELRLMSPEQQQDVFNRIEMLDAIGVEPTEFDLAAVDDVFEYLEENPDDTKGTDYIKNVIAPLASEFGIDQANSIIRTAQLDIKLDGKFDGNLRFDPASESTTPIVFDPTSMPSGFDPISIEPIVDPITMPIGKDLPTQPWNMDPGFNPNEPRGFAVPDPLTTPLDPNFVPGKNDPGFRVPYDPNTLPLHGEIDIGTSPNITDPDLIAKLKELAPDSSSPDFIPGTPSNIPIDRVRGGMPGKSDQPPISGANGIEEPKKPDFVPGAPSGIPVEFARGEKRPESRGNEFGNISVESGNGFDLDIAD